MTANSESELGEDLPSALSAVLTEAELQLLRQLSDPSTTAADVAQGLIRDALRD